MVGSRPDTGIRPEGAGEGARTASGVKVPVLTARRDAAKVQKQLEILPWS